MVPGLDVAPTHVAGAESPAPCSHAGLLDRSHQLCRERGPAGVTDRVSWSWVTLTFILSQG